MSRAHCDDGSNGARLSAPRGSSQDSIAFFIIKLFECRLVSVSYGSVSSPFVSVVVFMCSVLLSSCDPFLFISIFIRSSLSFYPRVLISALVICQLFSSRIFLLFLLSSFALFSLACKRACTSFFVLIRQCRSLGWILDALSKAQCALGSHGARLSAPQRSSKS